MREAQYTKSVTIAVQPDVFRKIKEITDSEKISIGEWFRNVAEKALSECSSQPLESHNLLGD